MPVTAEQAKLLQVKRLTFGTLFQSGGWWIGVHYSPNEKRYCLNFLPCLTIYWVMPGGYLPLRKLKDVSVEKDPLVFNERGEVMVPLYSGTAAQHEIMRRYKEMPNPPAVQPRVVEEVVMPCPPPSYEPYPAPMANYDMPGTHIDKVIPPLGHTDFTAGGTSIEELRKVVDNE